MSIIDQILGGSSSGDSTNENSNSSSFGSVLGTSPALGLSLSDVLHSSNSNTDGGNGGNGADSSTSDFTGIGDLGLGFQAPTVVGINSSNDSTSSSQTDGNHNGGGLLGGLL